MTDAQRRDRGTELNKPMRDAIAAYAESHAWFIAANTDPGVAPFSHVASATARALRVPLDNDIVKAAVEEGYRRLPLEYLQRVSKADPATIPGR